MEAVEDALLRATQLRLSLGCVLAREALLHSEHALELESEAREERQRWQEEAWGKDEPRTMRVLRELCGEPSAVDELNRLRSEHFGPKPHPAGCRCGWCE